MSEVSEQSVRAFEEFRAKFIIVGGFAVLCLLLLCWWLYSPGGLLNEHDWLSTKMTNFIPLRYTVVNNGDTQNFCFDICAKHGELKPMDCYGSRDSRTGGEPIWKEGTNVWFEAAKVLQLPQRRY